MYTENDKLPVYNMKVCLLFAQIFVVIAQIFGSKNRQNRDEKTGFGFKISVQKPGFNPVLKTGFQSLLVMISKVGTGDDATCFKSCPASCVLTTFFLVQIGHFIS